MRIKELITKEKMFLILLPGATRNKHRGVRRMNMLILLLKGLTGCSCKQASAWKKENERREEQKEKMEQWTNDTKKEKDCFFSFWYFYFILSDLGFQLSTISSSTNGFGARWANNVWDEMVFENQLFHVTKYSTINGTFRIVFQGLLYTANLNVTMTQGTRLVHMVFVGLQRPSHRALRAPLSANCMALDQVVLFSSFSPQKTISLIAGVFILGVTYA